MFSMRPEQAASQDLPVREEQLLPERASPDPAAVPVPADSAAAQAAAGAAEAVPAAAESAGEDKERGE